MTPKRAAVLRLGRLGDLVMTVPALRLLSEVPGLEPVLLTSSLYVDLMRVLVPGLCVLDTPGAQPYDALLDLHRVPASRRVVVPLQPRAPRVAVRKDDLRRRLPVIASRLRLPRPPAAGRSWPQRHLDAAGELLARLRLPQPAVPAPAQTRRSPGPAPTLGLVPGAGHATKQWPHFAELTEAWIAATGGRVICVTAPDEAALAAPLLARGAQAAPEPLAELPEALAACDVLVAGDTGPLHLAAALGVPVVALFGPTPRDAGFWVWGDRGTLLSLDLSCAPCSVHGGPRCPRSHHRCLVDLPVERVLQAALAQAPRAACA